MRTISLALALALSTACGSSFAGPSKQDQEKALSIVWEQSYGMEPGARPSSINWWSPDGCDEDYAMNGATLTNYCADGEVIIPSGAVYVRWKGSFHASVFADELALWRQYLMTNDANSAENPASIRMAENANLALSLAGL